MPVKYSISKMFSRAYEAKNTVVLILFLLQHLASGQDDRDRYRGVRVSGASVGIHKVALVIGNSSYDASNLSLVNPANDAADMATELRRLGYEVTVVLNARKNLMRYQFKDFGRKILNSKIAIFYYAGHGTQVDGENYLVPVDAVITDEAGIREKSVNLREMLQHLQQPGERVNLVILDACRNNPYRSTWSVTRDLKTSGSPQVSGLARIDITQLSNTLIAYSTQSDSLALDGASRNGLYTSVLLKEMRVPGRSVFEVFQNVRKAVETQSERRQIPWELSSLKENFYFIPSFANEPAESKNADASDRPGKWEVVTDRRVMIYANQSWVDAGIQIRSGQHISIKAASSGQVSLGSLGYTGPEGILKPDARKPMSSCLTGAVIARIGNKMICVGPETKVSAPAGGPLWLGINESKLADNRGTVVVKIVIQEFRP